MIKIIGTDNLNRETVADSHLVFFPESQKDKAKEFCDWLNGFSCHDHGGVYYIIVDGNHRLSRGMEDLV